VARAQPGFQNFDGGWVGCIRRSQLDLQYQPIRVREVDTLIVQYTALDTVFAKRLQPSVEFGARFDRKSYVLSLPVFWRSVHRPFAGGEHQTAASRQRVHYHQGFAGIRVGEVQAQHAGVELVRSARIATNVRNVIDLHRLDSLSKAISGDIAVRLKAITDPRLR
jgi:hypothetical protein